jgi:hypothetical protein
MSLGLFLLREDLFRFPNTLNGVHFSSGEDEEKLSGMDM